MYVELVENSVGRVVGFLGMISGKFLCSYEFRSQSEIFRKIQFERRTRFLLDATIELALLIVITRGVFHFTTHGRAFHIAIDGGALHMVAASDRDTAILRRILQLLPTCPIPSLPIDDALALEGLEDRPKLFYPTLLLA